MKVETAARFVGPNIFSAQPVIHYCISGLKTLGSAEIDSAARARLLQLLQQLSEAPPSCEAAESFAAKDVKDAEGRLPISHRPLWVDLPPADTAPAPKRRASRECP
jgi:hypothetical protein